MKTPPFLMGAALVFWGWQSGLLFAGVAMAVVLEGARYINLRWELADEDFRRVWVFCTILLLALAVFAFTSNGGAESLRGLMHAVNPMSQNAAGITVARTVISLMRWVPMVFFLFVGAQAYSVREGIPLITISGILRLRWKRAQRLGEPLPPGRDGDISHAYFLLTLLAASAHTGADNSYFWGVSVLAAWALWAKRSRRFSFAVWAGALVFVIVAGYFGQLGLGQLSRVMQNYSPEWLMNLTRGSFDPRQSRTQIGQIGRMKNSGRIVIRLETTNGSAPPAYLREASYNGYRSGVWVARNPNEDSAALPGMPGRSIPPSQTGATNLSPVAAGPRAEGAPGSPPQPLTNARPSPGAMVGSPPRAASRNRIIVPLSVVDISPDSDGTTWVLQPRKTNTASVNVGCYLDGGKALLPLPTGSGRLENLPAISLQKTRLGAVIAEGPGLVIFDARYGPGRTIDAAPTTNDDLDVPAAEMPALDRVIGELQLKGQDEEHALKAIEEFFASRFSYRLWQGPESLATTNETALGRFLAHTHSGHCEYFATATVLLLRELNFPARYAVGYAVHEGSGNKYVARQRDAHAWCLVWRDGVWQDFDTTPSSWIAAEGERASALQFLSDFWSRIGFEFSKFRWGHTNWRQYILWVLVPVLALLLYQIIFRSGRRRRRGQLGAPVRIEAWNGLDSEFYQIERELAQRGVVRRESEPMSGWLQRAAAESIPAELAGRIRQLLRLHYRLRFDPEGLSDAERAAMRKEAAACLESLGAH